MSIDNHTDKTTSHPAGIGVLGHYGNGNLGDEAIVAAVIDSIKRLRPETVIYGISVNPEDTRTRHSVESYPVRRIRSGIGQKIARDKRSQTVATAATGIDGLKQMLKSLPTLFRFLRWVYRFPWHVKNIAAECHFLWQSMKRLKNLDLIIVAGSGQLFDDWGGPFAYPYTLLSWTIMARLTGTRVAFLSLGASPLKSHISRIFIKRALSLAHHRSFRDVSSEKIITGIGFDGQHYNYPDLAWSLPSPGVNRAHPPGKIQVGINPIPFCDARYWPVHDKEKYDAYVGKLADLTRYLFQRNHTVSFFCTKQNTDGLVVRDVKKLLADGNGQDQADLSDKEILSLDDLMEIIARCDIVIASRFHGVILSCVMNIPVIGLAYEPKTCDILRAINLPELCLDIDDFSTRSLTDLLEEVVRRKDEIVEAMRPHTESFRGKLDEQYRMIFKLT